MRIVPTGFSGLFVLEPERAKDERGYFMRTFCAATFAAHGLQTNFVQWGSAYNSRAGTVRGLHFQSEPYAEVKLIRCTAGEVHDAIVDIRPRSPTYLQQFAIVLSRENGVSLYVDKGFAQGYQTLQDASEVSYAMSVDYHPEAATGLRWSDPAVAVTWPLPISVISARDRQWPLIGSEACPLPAPSKGGRT